MEVYFFFNFSLFSAPTRFFLFLRLFFIDDDDDDGIANMKSFQLTLKN